jgi:CheY-like chemotaxis protein
MLTEARDRDVDPLALIADRDQDSCALYTDFLQFHRWRVVGAAGGPEALAMAIARRPDVVVSETHLSGFDGMTLAELLRKDWTTAHIPIVFVTSDATAANLTKATASGAHTVLTKPCLPEDLFAAIVAAVDQSRHLRQHAAAAEAEARATLDRINRTVDQIGRATAARSLKDALQRGPTIVPPTTPAALRCPVCGNVMTYLRSHLGGVNLKNREQWDYFECPRQCGTFEYRVRTRKIRKVERAS